MNVILSYGTIYKYKQKNLEPKVAYSIVSKYYCSRMVIFGLCPQKCSECKPALDEMLRLEDAKNKAALLTYKARDEYAKAQEAHSIKEKTVRLEPTVQDLLRHKSSNSFENLLSVIDNL